MVIQNKSDVRHRNTLGWLDQYVETVQQSGPWSILGILVQAEDGNWDCDTVCYMCHVQCIYSSGRMRILFSGETKHNEI